MTANHLAAETSPYLLQHASNPVDWFPWGEEALRKAKREGKPIFLSIGYSACHWCHVMAHESFNDERIAAILNERFVSIKVDREERPDLDRIYMAAVQALTGNGGWPMSVFLTPDGAPFYGGTYYPPTARYGLPSFEQVLLAISDAWQYRREQILNAGRDILSVIQANTASQAPAREPLSAEILVEAESALTGSYDSNYGGWGDGPKFPQPMALAFLLRRYYATRNPAMLRVVAHTLEAIARGGMYDQLGGGFHRYAVDAQWLTPHFEKMLYDNAQLARVYLHAWQMTGESFFRTIAEETLDYLAREMTDAAGGFYSSQDADSDGHEGAFFTWAFGEAQAVLGSSFERFARSYPITVEGNFEGRNILTLSGSFEQREALADAREKMRQARDLRTRPGRDDKVLTSWNGLALAAFAEAARALDRSDYLALAERNATFSLAELRATNGRLYHTWKSGQARLNGYLEDYAYLIDGLLELYATTFEPRWFVAARELADTMIAHFASPDGFYDTSDDHELLIVRPSELQDNATPSGSAMASSVLLRLASLAQEPAYTTYAERNLMRVASLAGRYPQAFGQWLIALDALLMPPRQVAIVGDLASVEARALVQVCRDAYDPHLILAAGPQGSSEIVPLLKEYVEIGGRATAYVCSHAVCLAPVTEPSALQSLLESTRRA